MSKRVLLASLTHETHTFLPGLTTLKEFFVRRGEAILSSEGDVSTLGGVLEVARQQGWRVIPVIALGGEAGPRVADQVVEVFWSALSETVAREAGQGIDGLFLDLHGAMVSETWSDVEGELLSRARRLPGLAQAPIGGVLDLHCNFTEAMARHSDALIAYRENPHTDLRAAAMRAALLLDRLMQTGERPTTVREQPPLVWPPTGTGTADAPMRELEAQARAIESAHPEILAVNVFGGFSFADIHEAGPSFSAITLGDPDEARALLRELNRLAVSLQTLGNKPGLPLSTAIGHLGQHERGPVLLVEPADNIGGGAPGDLTIVLRALIEARVPGAGVIVNDPETVQALQPRAPGERVDALIGGKSGVVGAQPLPLTVEIVSGTNGEFTLEDPHSHLAYGGRNVSMGPCLVVQHGAIRILLTSRATPPFDLGQWRSQGIRPEDLRVINVKAAVGHR